jgi:hypothetical protein
MGDSRFARCFAGRRCLRQFRQGHDSIFLDLREYCKQSTCSCSKFPIDPMGKFLTCLPRLSLTQLRPMLRSTTGLCTCHRDSTFSHRPIGKFADVLALTHAFAGRRCRCRLRHCHDNVFLDLREYSLGCACSCSKSSHRPHGRLTIGALFCRAAVSM